MQIVLSITVPTPGYVDVVPPNLQLDSRTVDIPGSKYHVEQISLQHLYHIGSLERIAQAPIIVTRANTRNHCKLRASVLVARNALSMFHQKGAESLVLELHRVAAVQWNCTSVSVEFAHNGALSSVKQLWTERAFVATASQAEQRNEDVLLWVFVRKE